MKKWGAGGRGVEGSTSGVDGGGWETNSSRSVGRGLLACLLDDLVGARPPDNDTDTDEPATLHSAFESLHDPKRTGPSAGGLSHRPTGHAQCVCERERETRRRRCPWNGPSWRAFKVHDFRLRLHRLRSLLSFLFLQPLFFVHSFSIHFYMYIYIYVLLVKKRNSSITKKQMRRQQQSTFC